MYSVLLAITIFFAGDSTLHSRQYNGRFEHVQANECLGSWCDALAPYLKRGVRICNMALSGLSTRSFLEDGHWEHLCSRIEPGDYVYIQFGHNDQKTNTRHFASIDVYRANLTRFAREVRARGGTPVFGTPMVRRCYGTDGRIADGLGDYPAAVRALGAELGVSVFDFNAMSREIVERAGPEASLAWYRASVDGKDFTHPTKAGAAVFARAFARRVGKADSPLKALFTEDGRPTPQDVLWDDRPADGNWENSWYPLGNGAMGCMVDGGTDVFRVQFNADAFWSGGKTPSDIVDDARCLELDAAFGDYQALGTLEIHIPRLSGVSEYCRELDLAKAMYRDSFTSSGAGDALEVQRFTRRVVASRADNLIAIRVESDVAISFPLVVKLAGAHGETDVTERGFTGVLPSGLGYRVEVTQSVGPKSVTVFLRARTSYDPKRADFGCQGRVPPSMPFAPMSFDRIVERHLREYAPYFNRLAFELEGDEDLSALTTRARVIRCRRGFRDVALEALLYKYGRYLLIASSRPGTLPANLQGVWNNSNTPAWHGDYHTNINLQMNYWGADAANLSECFEPLADWMAFTRPTCEAMTRAAFPQSKGYAYRTSANPFGGGTFKWNFAGAPWLAAMLYDHYRYTGDKAWLGEKAWPLMKGAAEFMEGRLRERPDGSVVVADGWSPEHGPREDAITHDQQIVRELFRAIADAARELKVDDGFTRRIADLEKRLLREKVGRWGQLQEWETDRDVKGDMHRHTSHLYGVYPGTTVSKSETPTLFEAAKVSLAGRAENGDARRSWTWPWRAALWARLGESEQAGEMIFSLMRHNLLDNLFCTHPPFQIDGNLGILGAMSEMLVRSHERTPDGKVILRMLPALPDAWARGGRISGLRVRGGYVVSLEWRDGKIASKTVEHGTPDGYVIQ